MTTRKRERPTKPGKHRQTDKDTGRPQVTKDALLQFTDDFAEYADLSAFICNAFAATLKEHQWLTPEIVSGARLCSCWLERRANKLKAELHSVLRQCDETITNGR